MKKITQVIKFLEGMELVGGDIDGFEIDMGIREATPQDKEWNPKFYKRGFSQKVPDGTFIISITGHKNTDNDRPAKSKKSTGEKKGKKRSS
jgi:hypothetical protein